MLIPSWLIIIALFTIGAIAGSFASMLVYRLPIMCLQDEQISLYLPRSHCPKCKQSLTWWQLFPLISFIFQRGKCANCQQNIAKEYFYIEVVFALTPLLMIMLFSDFRAVIAIIFVWYLITLSIIDAKHKILPDQITLSGIWVGLLFNTASPELATFTNLTQAIYGAVLGYSLPFCINFIFTKIRGYAGMGFGDFKMLAMVGAWLGAMNLMATLMLASLIAIIFMLVKVAIRRGNIKDQVAFGGFIAIGAVAVILLESQQIEWLSLLVLI